MTPARAFHDTRASMARLIAEWYKALPAPVKRMAQPILFPIRLARLLWQDPWLMEGHERSSGLPISLVFAGHPKTRFFIRELIFRDSCRESRLGPAGFWRMAGAARGPGGDAAIQAVAMHASVARLFDAREWFLLPGWVQGEIPMPPGAEVMQNNSVKSDRRRIRKNGLTYTVTRDPGRLRAFYDHMYVPHITSTYGDSAHLDTYECLKGLLGNADLLMVLKDGVDVGGSLIVYEPDAPRVRNFGVARGNEDFLFAGVGAALYYFPMLYLAKKGFTRMNCGLSRSFLCDGVLNFKRKWDMRIMDVSSETIALRFRADTPATRAFLLNNPFIISRRGQLSALVFVERDGPPPGDMITGTRKRFFYRGLSDILICNLRAKDQSGRGVAPADLDGMASSARIFDSGRAPEREGRRPRRPV